MRGIDTTHALHARRCDTPGLRFQAGCYGSAIVPPTTAPPTQGVGRHAFARWNSTRAVACIFGWIPLFVTFGMLVVCSRLYLPRVHLGMSWRPLLLGKTTTNVLLATSRSNPVYSPNCVIVGSSFFCSSRKPVIARDMVGPHKVIQRIQNTTKQDDAVKDVWAIYSSHLR